VPDLPTYGFTGAALTQAMRALGDTPNAIAEKLADLGCRGRLKCEQNCPLAQYVHLAYPIVQRVFVYCNDNGAAFVQAGYGYGEESDWIESEDLPAHGEFVRKFDKGYYPDLIEEAADVR
jgi:hypothetical protein